MKIIIIIISIISIGCNKNSLEVRMHKLAIETLNAVRRDNYEKYISHLILVNAKTKITYDSLKNLLLCSGEIRNFPYKIDYYQSSGGTLSLYPCVLFDSIAAKVVKFTFTSDSLEKNLFLIDIKIDIPINNRTTTLQKQIISQKEKRVTSNLPGG